MLRDKSLAEDDHVVVVDQSLGTQSRFVIDRPSGELFLAVPGSAIAVEYRAPMPTKIDDLVWMIRSEECFSRLSQQPLAHSLRSDRQWKWYRESGQAPVWHQQMPQAKAMHRADEQIRSLS